ncbi:hypothetical protein [Nonomuraea sp. NPDC050783]|uniref:hypothetical protein n=1 Tax=Nonomuraea sp. NPDC050783 TaxID=3154634 RepID=UPI00346626FA
MRKQAARPFAPPLDLRFIDLFMAIVLALSFVAIMLTVVARMLPAEPPAAPAPARQDTARQDTAQRDTAQRADRQRTVAQLQRRLDAAVRARREAEAELRVLEADAAGRTAFALPWWLVGLCALLGVLAVLVSWRIRLWRDGGLPRLRSWLLVTAVVAAVTVAIRSLGDGDGDLLLAEIPWWAADALCLGLLLVAYVLVTDIRAGRARLAEIRAEGASWRAGEPRPRRVRRDRSPLDL